MTSEFTFTIRHIHNWTSFPLWLSLFILSGAIFCSSPVAYWISTDLEASSFSVISFGLSIFFMEFSRTLKWFAITFSSGPCFVRPWLWGTCTSAGQYSHKTCLSLGWSFWVCKASLASGCWPRCYLGAWAKALLELLAGANWYWRIPSRRGLPDFSAVSGCPGTDLQSRSCGEWKAPKYHHCGWPPWGQSTTGFSFYRNPFESVLVRWIKPELIIQS